MPDYIVETDPVVIITSVRAMVVEPTDEVRVLQPLPPSGQIWPPSQ